MLSPLRPDVVARESSIETGFLIALHGCTIFQALVVLCVAHWSTTKLPASSARATKRLLPNVRSKRIHRTAMFPDLNSFTLLRSKDAMDSSVLIGSDFGAVACNERLSSIEAES